MRKPAQFAEEPDEPEVTRFWVVGHRYASDPADSRASSYLMDVSSSVWTASRGQAARFKSSTEAKDAILKVAPNYQVETVARMAVMEIEE